MGGTKTAVKDGDYTALEGFERKVVSVTGVKVLDDAKGIVQAYVAGIGNVDAGDDIIEPGFFESSLNKHLKKNPKGVYAHIWERPVSKMLETRTVAAGSPELPDRIKAAGAGGQYVKMQYILTTQGGRDAFEEVKFFGDEQEWCVDEDTEILTTRGWLRYDELTTEDEAYVLDPQTLTGRFEPVQAVNVWPRKRRTMRLIETGGHSSLTTLNHRWLAWRREKNRYAVAWRTTEQLNAAAGIFRTAPRADVVDTPKWSDAFVEIVAWFFTEGWLSRGAVYIGQSERKNPAHVAAIRAALTSEFPGGFTEHARKDDMSRFYLRADASEAIRAVTSKNKAPSAAFLCSLTQAQLVLFIARCIDGDGHRGHGGVCFYQSDENASKMFEMACALAGAPTNSYPGKDYGNRFGRAPFVTRLLKSSVAKPLDAIRVKTYNDKPRRTPATDELVEHVGIVWCPTTPSGTWLARRRGTVYFTGNSVGYVPIGAYRDKEGKRHLPESEWYEWSQVLFGMNPITATIGVKALAEQANLSFEAALERLRKMAADETNGEKVRAMIAELGSVDSKAAIARHKTATSDDAWDGPANEARLSNDAGAATFRKAFAWVDSDKDADTKAAYRFVHHEVDSDGKVGAANVKACTTGVGVLNGGRGGTTIPDDDVEGVYRHLAGHITDSGAEPPELKTSGDGETKTNETETKQLAGSIEERLVAISDAIDAWVNDTYPAEAETNERSVYGWSVATWDAHVVACVVDYGAETAAERRRFFDFPYVVQTDGTVVLGAPTEVQLETVVTPKSLVAALECKEGRRHSAKDTEALQSIHDAAVVLGAACGAEDEKVVTADELTGKSFIPVSAFMELELARARLQ
jgi:hypothetical protein